MPPELVLSELEMLESSLGPWPLLNAAFSFPGKCRRIPVPVAFFGLVSRGVGLWLGRVHLALQQSVPTFPRTGRRGFS